MKEEIVLIPIDQIRILNPRHRDRRKFELVVESIKTLGLKKPIKVSVRSNQKEGEAPYDLVCGQGRIEAFKALGHTEIPAIVADLPKEERLLMSLVENIARHAPYLVAGLAALAIVGTVATRMKPKRNEQAAREDSGARRGW